ncbi:MAG: chorismate mutase [Gemmatimonadetes bacterium]|nr:chorismate mutase [Gemmatimonadota bacterium]
MSLTALRGAITVDADEPHLVADATRELLQTLLQRNALDASGVISAFFTCTADLVSAYPAQAARDLGWTHVPMLCAADLPVRGALPRCIRVLLHVDWRDGAAEPRHAYLRGAVALRGDLTDGAP